MPLDLVNPFEEVVILDKRYKIAVPPQSSQTLRAITPTGRHVSHANKLGHWNNSKGGGGRATKLERYTPRKGGKMGVGHKKALVQVGKSVEGGLAAIGRIPKAKKVPGAPKSGLGDRLKNGPIQPPSAPDVKTPSVFSLKRTSGKAIAGGGAAGAGLGAYGLHRHNEYERGQGALASKALAPVTPPAAVGAMAAPAMALKPTKPMLPKSPVQAKAPASKLNSNMPAGAKTGRRLP